MRWFLAACITVAASVYIARRGALASPFVAPDEPEVQQGPDWLDEAATMINPSTYTQPAVSAAVADGNVQAFLRVLRYAEGTAGDEGYRTLFGGGLFEDFSDHPRIAQQFRTTDGRTLWTSAAGAYQFMAVSPLPGGGSTRVDTWDRVRAKLQLPDFSPESQDAAAVELIRERGALGDVMAGRLADAIRKCAPVWASLPGAGYAQPERKLSQLAAAFLAAGGITEA